MRNREYILVKGPADGEILYVNEHAIDVMVPLKLAPDVGWWSRARSYLSQPEPIQVAIYRCCPATGYAYWWGNR